MTLEDWKEELDRLKKELKQLEHDFPLITNDALKDWAITLSDEVEGEIWAAEEEIEKLEAEQ